MHSYTVFLSKCPYPTEEGRHKLAECNTRAEAFAAMQSTRNNFHGLNFVQIIHGDARRYHEYLRIDVNSDWTINETGMARVEDLPPYFKELAYKFPTRVVRMPDEGYGL